MDETPRAATTRWTNNAARLRWAELDGEYVVYCVDSGKTHYLNQAAAVLIRDILDATHPKSTREVVAQLAEAHDTSATAGFTQLIERLLNDLDELGLVERRDG